MASLHLLLVLLSLALLCICHADPLEDGTTPAPATRVINNVCVSTSDVEIDPSRNLWFRLFTPKTNSDKPLPFIVYIHGGGFNQFGPNTTAYDNLCSNLAAKSLSVIASINYHLTPKYKYPTQYEDAFEALKFLDTADLPANADRGLSFIAGDSAGGNIVFNLTVRALQNTDQFTKIKVAGALCVQPFYGGENRTASELREPRDPIFNVDNSDKVWKAFLPDGANRDFPAAHIFGGGAKSDAAKQLKKLKKYPPTLVITAENDLLLDWQRKYIGWLKECGKKVEVEFYPKTGHAFYLYKKFPQTPLFDLLYKRLTNFIHNHL